MIKIWAKILREHKIVRDTLYQRDDKFDESRFLEYMTDLCYILDTPTPVILKSHVKNFVRYNITKFRPTDFIETVDFDLLQLENAVE